MAYSTEGEVTQRFSEIEKALGENPDQLLTECEAPKRLHWKQLLPLPLAFLSFPPSYTVPDSQAG
ncbi:MAG: hypothetical protein AAF383_20125 [Cyanobacteria bacterium P01_A01_bin.83]